MKYFKKSKQPRKILFFVVGIAALAAIVLLYLPYQVSLTTEAHGLNITETPKLNLPCSKAELTAGDTTIVKTTLNGNGYASVSYLQEDEQLKLRLIGLLRNIDCTINIELKSGDTVELPTSMAFVARKGVHPVPAPAGAFRTFKY